MDKSLLEGIVASFLCFHIEAWALPFKINKKHYKKNQNSLLSFTIVL